MDTPTPSNVNSPSASTTGSGGGFLGANTHTGTYAALPPPKDKVLSSSAQQHQQQQQQQKQQQQYSSNSKSATNIPPPEEAGREDLSERFAASLTINTNTNVNNSMNTSQQQSPSMNASTITNTNASQITHNAMDAHLHPRSVATLSQAWEYDDLHEHCYACSKKFNLIERKHHCRYCGKIFCHACSKHKSLIPPSAIVLVPHGGKKVTSRHAQDLSQSASFSPQEDPDRMLTYVASTTSTSQIGGNDNASAVSSGGAGGEVLLYGKGLEERFQLAREPLRVCNSCHITLAPLQPELQRSNSHAMRFNHIDPTDLRRLFNSPLAFTLGHEVRKAAYTLNNLLPQPKRRLGATLDFNTNYNSNVPGIHQQCQESCANNNATMSQLDGLRIPAKLLEQAKGLAVLTVVKGGFGLAGVEFGTGLVVARLQENTNSWSAPSAIGMAGLAWGALVGAQVSDHVFVCMTYEAVEMLMSSNGSVQLGADMGVAVGPVGRAVEADYGASPHHVAPIYTYSLSKGLYAGVSVDGKVIMTRHNVNEKFYGHRVKPEDILQGRIPTPPAAQPLYDALTRCQVYTQPNFHASRRASGGLFDSTSNYNSSSIYNSSMYSNMYSNMNMNMNTTNTAEGMEYGEWNDNSFGTSGGSTLGGGHRQQQQQQLNWSTQEPDGMSPYSSGILDPTSPLSQPQQQPSPMMQTSLQQQQQQQPPQQLQTQPTFAQLPPPKSPATPSNQQQQQQQLPMPPAANDQHSYAGMSDITSDPGY